MFFFLSKEDDDDLEEVVKQISFCPSSSDSKTQTEKRATKGEEEKKKIWRVSFAQTFRKLFRIFRFRKL
jgi:hypothetical protein